MSFHDACMLCLLDFVGPFGFAVCFQQLAGTLGRPQFAKHCHRYFELVPCVFNGFLELSIIRIDASPLPDHMYPFGGFSYSIVNLVNPVHESDKLSIRRSCNTSKFVCCSGHIKKMSVVLGMSLLSAH